MRLSQGVWRVNKSVNNIFSFKPLNDMATYTF